MCGSPNSDRPALTGQAARDQFEFEFGAVHGSLVAGLLCPMILVIRVGVLDFPKAFRVKKNWDNSTKKKEQKF